MPWTFDSSGGDQYHPRSKGDADVSDLFTLLGYRRPLLATSTNGVGTKVAVASASGGCTSAIPRWPPPSWRSPG